MSIKQTFETEYKKMLFVLILIQITSFFIPKNVLQCTKCLFDIIILFLRKSNENQKSFDNKHFAF